MFVYLGWYIHGVGGNKELDELHVSEFDLGRSLVFTWYINDPSWKQYKSCSLRVSCGRKRGSVEATKSEQFFLCFQVPVK